MRKYKSVLLFILTFLGSYLALVSLYNLYLVYGGSQTYYPDFITHSVAQQSELLIQGFGYDGRVEPSAIEPAMNLSVEGAPLARIIEGCNAVSIILLFISFMLAFWGGAKRTLLFIFGGSVLIYVINVFRIAILAIGIYEYPEYAEILHGTVFPAIIYGAVFLLWLAWVKSYTKPATDA
nr:exosortase family protein XrtF [Dokdonia sinensis]